LSSKDGLVSVVIPCYNSGTTLQETLDSVERQTYQNLEVIVVDDGSDDATKALLSALGDRVILISQENKGLSAARNTGIRNSSGDYVLPLDADDYLHPDFIKLCMDELSAVNNKIFVFTYLNCFGDTVGVLEKTYNRLDQLFVNQLPYCMLYPKQAWRELGGYDEDMRLGYEDWEFNIRLGIHGYVGVVVKRPLFNYRVSSSGMLKSVSGNRHGMLWAYIQKKHKQHYRPSALYVVWKEWRSRPSAYPPWVYIGAYLLFHALPSDWFSRVFSKMRIFSASNRM